MPLQVELVSPERILFSGEATVSVIGDNVKILSDLAEVKSGIDVARAQRAKDKAEEAIRRGDDAEAEASLQRAHARLKAAGQLA